MGGGKIWLWNMMVYRNDIGFIIIIFNICVLWRLFREHHHVRGSAAVRVGVCAHRGDLVHVSDPDGAADGGADRADVALADDRSRTPQSGLLHRIPRLLTRVHRWVCIIHTPLAESLGLIHYKSKFWVICA